MLKIRLQRVGRIHAPTFRLVLTDSKNSTKSGRFKEILGSYDPRATREVINADRVKHWLTQGALTTDTVHNLLINQKIIEGKKINVLPKKTFTPAPKVEEPVVEAAQVAETPVEEVTPEAEPEATPETVEAPTEPEAVVETAPEAAPEAETASE